MSVKRTEKSKSLRLRNQTANLMASSRMSSESPPASHIENPARPASLIYLPLAAVPKKRRINDYPPNKGIGKAAYQMRQRRRRTPSPAKWDCRRKAEWKELSVKQCVAARASWGTHRLAAAIERILDAVLDGPIVLKEPTIH